MRKRINNKEQSRRFNVREINVIVTKIRLNSGIKPAQCNNNSYILFVRNCNILETELEDARQSEISTYLQNHFNSELSLFSYVTVDIPQDHIRKNF